MLEEYQRTFYTYLTAYDREKALSYVLDLLHAQKITVPELYEQIITKSLNQITVCRRNEDERVWQEHTMTNITRTIVECCFPFVLEQKNKIATQNKDKTVVVVCPEEEYHDIGARMGADFFTLENYNVIFVGGNTPKNNILSLCETLKPTILAISVSNFYSISIVKDTIEELKQRTHVPTIVIAGGAFARTGVQPQDIGADALLFSHKQVQELGGVLA